MKISSSVSPMVQWCLLMAVAGLFLAGCSTPGVDWDKRLGVYTAVQATAELGHPAKTWALEDGSSILEFITQSPQPWSGGYAGRISNPNQRPQTELNGGDGSGTVSILTLTFAPNGRLLYWHQTGTK